MKLESIDDLKNLVNWEYKGGEYKLDLEYYELDRLRPKSLKKGAEIVIVRKKISRITFCIFSKMPYESFLTNKKLKSKNQFDGIKKVTIEIPGIEEVLIKTFSEIRALDFGLKDTPTLIIFRYNLGNVKINKTAWRIENAVCDEKCINIFSEIINFMKFMEIPLEDLKALYSKLNNDFNNLKKTFKRKFPFIIPAFIEGCKKELTNEELLYVISSEI